jgi:hypothetical protein
MENNFLHNKLFNNNKMFDDSESINLSNINKQHVLPNIKSNFSELSGPDIPFGYNKNDLKISKPDWTPDFSEKIDVIGDTINLALYTLGMSRSEYNSSDISNLKSQRRIDCSSEKIWALNILIYYKKNTNVNLPDLSPIKHLNSNLNTKRFDLDEF